MPSPAVETPIVFVDLETTGGSVADHRITEIGIVEAGASGVTRWTTLVNPHQPIPPFIQQLTGITDDMVRGAPAFDDIAAELHGRLEGKLFIAHNANFDRGFLRSEFSRAGFSFNPDVLCTVRLSRALQPGEKRHGLDALIDRHGLVPLARHRALADADLLWQFWRRLHGLWPVEVLREHVERTLRRYRIAGDITEDVLDQVPPGCGVYAFFDESGAALYVGRSVRLRQRVRAHLAGERRSARELRIAQQVRRLEWRETGGEVGALLVEAQWVEALRPTFNRAVRASRTDPTSAAWPFGSAIAFEERGEAAGSAHFHVVDRWRYLGSALSMAAAAELVTDGTNAGFDLSTYRILSAHLERGLEIVPLLPVPPVLPVLPSGSPCETALEQGGLPAA
ncbi:DNA polymerase/helicase [Trinickia caryophylli]|nr:DNA polymerase/helicase [Trinickia caryophylli]